MSQGLHGVRQAHRELRFQHAADMRSELLRLKRDTETGKRLAVAGSGPVAALMSRKKRGTLGTARLFSCCAWVLRRLLPPNLCPSCTLCCSDSLTGGHGQLSLSTTLAR